jgi:hypothetical protein
MTATVYKFAFDDTVSEGEVAETMGLAMIGLRSLYGEVGARLGVGHYLDHRRRQCVIDARTPEGRDLCSLFTGFLTFEFGAAAFTVEPAEPRPSTVIDEEEHRTLADWAKQHDLDAGEVASLMATDPSLNLASPLTQTELNDLVGLSTRRPNRKEAAP